MKIANNYCTIARCLGKHFHVRIFGYAVLFFLGCERSSHGTSQSVVIAPSPKPSEQSLLLSELGTTFETLHGDRSPTIDRLIEIGESSVDECLKIFAQENGMWRLLHAQRVIEGYTMRRFGYQSGQGFTTFPREAWETYCNSLGHLNYSDPIETRLAAVSGWADWRTKLPAVPKP